MADKRLKCGDRDNDIVRFTGRALKHQIFNLPWVQLLDETMQAHSAEKIDGAVAFQERPHESVASHEHRSGALWRWWYYGQAEGHSTIAHSERFHAKRDHDAQR